MSLKIPSWLDRARCSRCWRLLYAAILALSSGLAIRSHAADANRTNIVMVLVDDMGYGDLRPEIMPRCFALSEQKGTRLNFYTMQNCQPTRAALMSGKMPARFNLHSVWPTPIDRGMPPEEKLLPEHLKEAGYRTGIFGKWHLGWKSRAQWPMNQGFDEFIGCLGGHLNSYGAIESGLRYDDGTTGHDHHTIHDFQWNGTPLYSSEYSSFVFRDASVRFIERCAKSNDPFFLYVPFNAPHGPFSAPREYVDRAASLPGVDASVIPRLGVYASEVLAVPLGSDEQLYLDSNQLLYKAMMMALDDAVADIYDSLEESGVADNTLFFFASDNGPSYTSSNGPAVAIGDNAWLRAFKGQPYEGGHYVANFMIWPDRIAPGQRIDSNVWVGDLMPTFLDAAGLPIPADVDGGSALDAFDNNTLVNRQFSGTRIYSHVQKSQAPAVHHDPDVTDVGIFTINRRWQKYIRRMEFGADGRVRGEPREEFYDLRFDPSERKNVVLHPSYVNLMKAMRRNYRLMGGDRFMEGIESFRKDRPWDGFVVPDEFGFDESPIPLQTDLTP